MAKGSMPTLNIAQLIHIMYQIENLTGHSVDDLIDMIFSGNVSASFKQVFYDTFDRIKNDPLDVGANAFLYAVIFKLAKKAARKSKLSTKINMGFFYLQPI